MTPAAVTVTPAAARSAEFFAAGRPCCRDLRCPRCASNKLHAQYWPVVRHGRVLDRYRLACRCGHVWITDPPNSQPPIVLPEAAP